MPKYILLTQGYYAIVDAEDYEWLNQWMWFYTTKGYAARNNPDGNGYIWMHHAIADKHNLVFKPELDHKDRNGLNNQKPNFRNATKSQQQVNQNKQINNTSGFIGVCWDADRQKWLATIVNANKQISLGRYNSIIEAAKIRDKANLYYNGEFAVLNLPDSIYEYLAAPYVDTSNRGSLSLTDGTVIKILTLAWSGTKQKVIAAKYNLSQSVISEIINRKTYKHVKWNPWQKMGQSADES
jgi:hypothetical protein